MPGLQSVLLSVAVCFIHQGHLYGLSLDHFTGKSLPTYTWTNHHHFSTRAWTNHWTYHSPPASGPITIHLIRTHHCSLTSGPSILSGPKHIHMHLVQSPATFITRGSSSTKHLLYLEVAANKVTQKTITALSSCCAQKEVLPPRCLEKSNSKHQSNGRNAADVKPFRLPALQLAKMLTKKIICF